MSDLAAKLIVLQNQKQTIATQKIALQNQKQTIATQYEELNNEITALSQNLALVSQEQKRVERDIVLLEIEQHLDDFASSLQIFATIELHKILTELNKNATMEEKNRFRSVLQKIYMLRKQQGNWELIAIKRMTDPEFLSENGYAATFRMSVTSNSFLTYHL